MEDNNANPPHQSGDQGDGAQLRETVRLLEQQVRLLTEAVERNARGDRGRGRSAPQEEMDKGMKRRRKASGVETFDNPYGIILRGQAFQKIQHFDMVADEFSNSSVGDQKARPCS